MNDGNDIMLQGIASDNFQAMDFFVPLNMRRRARACHFVGHFLFASPLIRPLDPISLFLFLFSVLFFFIISFF